MLHHTLLAVFVAIALAVSTVIQEPVPALYLPPSMPHIDIYWLNWQHDPWGVRLVVWTPDAVAYQVRRGDVVIATIAATRPITDVASVTTVLFPRPAGVSRLATPFYLEPLNAAGEPTETYGPFYPAAWRYRLPLVLW